MTINKFLNIQILSMGQNQTSVFQQLMKDYRVDKQQPQHMQTYLTHKQSERQFLFKEFTFNQLREFSLTSERLNGRKNINNIHITRLSTFEERVEDAMCSNFYKLYTLWDFPHPTLEDDLQEKTNNFKQYPTSELKNILSSSVDALRVLQAEDIKHECLTASAILHDKNGLWKVADPLALDRLSNFDQCFGTRDKKGIYLSPEQCWAIQNQRPIQNKNSFKNDVFILGIILLQCGLNENQRQCYSSDYSQVCWEVVHQNMARFSRRHQELDLSKLLEVMLAKEINNRPDWFQLSQLMTNKVLNYNKSTVLKSYKAEPQQQVNALPTIHSVEPEPNFSNLNRQTLTSIRNHPIVTTAPPEPLRPASINPIAKIHFISPSRLSSPVNLQQRESNRMQISIPQKRNKINFNIVSSAYNSVRSPVASPQHTISTSNRFPASPAAKNGRNTVTFNSTFGHSNQPQPNISLKQEIPTQNRPLPQQVVTTNEVKKVQQQVDIQIEAQDQPSEEPQLVEEYFKFGSRYEGYKLNGKRHGHGIFYYQDGGRYDGEWKNDRMNGQGSLYYQSNIKAYEGQWLDDQFNGKGLLYNQNPEPFQRPFNYDNFDDVEDHWVTYQGYFSKDTKDGEGTLRLSNGEEFMGIFKSDMVDGEGRFFTLNNGVIYGLWHQNQLVRTLQ